MKILYHILHPNVNAAERWIYEAWRDGFTALGHTVSELRVEHDLEKRLLEISPDIFMTDIAILDLRVETSVLKEIRSKGTKVAIWVHWPLVDSVAHNAHNLIEDDVADVYFGEREADHAIFLRDTGKTYHCIAHAANPLRHFPVAEDKQYASDILYIGSRLPHKKWFEINVIEEIRRQGKYKVKVIGMGWAFRDVVLRALRKMTRVLRLHALKNLIERNTVKIDDDEERIYYSSAKICLNFHEREPDGSQPHYIVNQRTFKIPACGGFQICDDVPAIRKYFDESEIVLLPLVKERWMEAIDFYMSNSGEREKIRGKGIIRATKDHMSTARCQWLIKYCFKDSKEINA